MNIKKKYLNPSGNTTQVNIIITKATDVRRVETSLNKMASNFIYT